MKLLDRFEDVIEAEEIARQLEALGIPAYVSATNSHLFGRIQTGALKVAVWIVLNHQFADAKAYLEDDSHLVTTGLSVAEMAEIQEQTSDYAFRFFNRALLFGVLTILAFVAVTGWYWIKQGG